MSHEPPIDAEEPTPVEPDEAASEAAPEPASTEPEPAPDDPALLAAILDQMTPEQLGELLRRADDRDRLFDRAARLQSELENVLKRGQRERQDWLRQANHDLLHDVLPVVDGLGLALANLGEAEGALAAFADGVRNIEHQLHGILDRHGVTPIEAAGQPFDPAVHEALLSQPSSEHPDQTVLNVLEPGYMLHDKVLRPAKVAVSRAAD